MLAFLSLAEEWVEEGEAVPLLPVPDTLEPVDYRILALLYQGRKIEEIALEVERTRREVHQRTLRARFKYLQAQVEKGIVESVSRAGEYEPVTIARTQASGAMRRIVAQSKTTSDPRVYLAANREVLRMAGVEPPRRIELVTPEKLLDQMTVEELDHFAATREWPLRFKEQLAQFLSHDGQSVTIQETKSVTFAGSHRKKPYVEIDESKELGEDHSGKDGVDS